jgi:hypothetical protein
VPRTSLLKFGAATGAALAGVILAITSVAAHSTQASTVHQSGKSVVGTVIDAARFASFPVFKPDAPLSAVTNSIELETEADAAELLEAQQEAAAKAAAEAAELAAEQAAAAAAAAAEAAEATCSATDVTEDAAEKAAAQAAEAAETPGAAEQPEASPDADLAADTTEAACAGGEKHTEDGGDHHSDSGENHTEGADKKKS